jgi:hypothetical protein
VPAVSSGGVTGAAPWRARRGAPRGKPARRPRRPLTASRRPTLTTLTPLQHVAAAARTGPRKGAPHQRPAGRPEADASPPCPAHPTPRPCQGAAPVTTAPATALVTPAAPTIGARGPSRPRFRGRRASHAGTISTPAAAPRSRRGSAVSPGPGRAGRRRGRSLASRSAAGAAAVAGWSAGWKEKAAVGAWLTCPPARPPLPLPPRSREGRLRLGAR